MPTYVYRFIDSGEIIEVQQAFTDEPFTTLVDPADGTTRAVKKVFTPVGVSFKGGGFYKTDSRNGSSSSSSTPVATPVTGTGDSTSKGDLASSTTSSSSADTSSTPASTPVPSTSPSTSTGTPGTSPNT